MVKSAGTGDLVLYPETGALILQCFCVWFGFSVWILEVKALWIFWYSMNIHGIAWTECGWLLPEGWARNHRLSCYWGIPACSTNMFLLSVSSEVWLHPERHEWEPNMQQNQFLRSFLLYTGALTALLGLSSQINLLSSMYLQIFQIFWLASKNVLGFFRSNGQMSFHC